MTSDTNENSLRNLVEHYVSELKSGDAENAWFCLMDEGPAAIPYLEAAFDHESDPDVRVSLVQIISQARIPGSLPFLTRALHDPHPDIWKSAVDALVTLNSREAVEALEEALELCTGSDGRLVERRDWIQEAIEQMSGAG